MVDNRRIGADGKKKEIKAEDGHYVVIDVETGEVETREDTFTQAREAIGALD